ncbi:hypothetical protein ACSBR2_022838 [Camellia fascicularis]
MIQYNLGKSCIIIKAKHPNYVDIQSKTNHVHLQSPQEELERFQLNTPPKAYSQLHPTSYASSNMQNIELKVIDRIVEVLRCRFVEVLCGNKPKRREGGFLILVIMHTTINQSMEKILEKYERYSYAERRLASPDSELQGSWSMEYHKLTARIEVLQRNIRHYVGEDLDPLSLRELQNLEQQIDTALKKTRSRKNQLMHESISELQKKEKALHEQNYLLANKLKESEKTMAEQVQWEQQTQNSSALTLPQPPRPPPPPTLHTLTIGGTYLQARGDDDDDAHARPSPNALMPPWMLRHMNH